MTFSNPLSTVFSRKSLRVNVPLNRLMGKLYILWAKVLTFRCPPKRKVQCSILNFLIIIPFPSSLKEREISSLVQTLQRDVADYSQVILDEWIVFSETSPDGDRACVLPQLFCSKSHRKSRKMALNERQGPLRFLIPLAIVLLVVYCVSLSVFLV